MAAVLEVRAQLVGPAGGRRARDQRARRAGLDRRDLGSRRLRAQRAGCGAPAQAHLAGGVVPYGLVAHERLGDDALHDSEVALLQGPAELLLHRGLRRLVARDDADAARLAVEAVHELQFLSV